MAKAEGRAEGQAELLRELLAERLAPVPEELQQRIHRLRIEQLTALGKALLKFDSVEDLEVSLDANR